MAGASLHTPRCPSRPLRSSRIPPLQHAEPVRRHAPDLGREPRAGLPARIPFSPPRHGAPVGLPSPGRGCSLTTREVHRPGAASTVPPPTAPALQTETAEGATPPRARRQACGDDRGEPGAARPRRPRQRAHRRTGAVNPGPRRHRSGQPRNIRPVAELSDGRGVDRDRERQLGGRVSHGSRHIAAKEARLAPAEWASRSVALIPAALMIDRHGPRLGCRWR